MALTIRQFDEMLLHLITATPPAPFTWKWPTNGWDRLPELSQYEKPAAHAKRWFLPLLLKHKIITRDPKDLLYTWAHNNPSGLLRLHPKAIKMSKAFRTNTGEYVEGTVLDWLRTNTPQTEKWRFGRNEPIGRLMYYMGIKSDSAYKAMVRALSMGLATRDEHGYYSWLEPGDYVNCLDREVQKVLIAYANLPSIKQEMFQRSIGATPNSTASNAAVLKKGKYECVIRSMELEPLRLCVTVFHNSTKLRDKEFSLGADQTEINSMVQEFMNDNPSATTQLTPKEMAELEMTPDERRLRAELDAEAAILSESMFDNKGIEFTSPNENN